MNTVKAILNDFIVYLKPNTKFKAIRLAVLMLIIGAIAIFALSPEGEEVSTEVDSKGVVVRNLNELGDGASLSLVGTVRAVDQATIQTEVGGQATSVRVKLGDRVGAGATIATLENASEYAALLQAEGAYEAAQANAAQSGFSVETSQENLTSAISSANNTYRSTYVTVENVMQGTISNFFSGVTRDQLQLEEHYWNFKLIEYALEDWQQLTATSLSEPRLTAEITEAESLIADANAIVDIIFAEVLAEENGATPETKAQMTTFKTNLTSARSSLASAKTSLQNARLSVDDAEAALSRNQSASTGGEISAADAQVKQALGSLRAAQANYSKTILRTPVAGEVQSLNINTGDFVGMNTVAAIVAGANSLEITTFVSTNERNRLSVGDSVTLAGGGTGVITAIAPAVDSATGKVEVKIASESEKLVNGDTVRLSISGSNTVVESTGPIVIPVAALKVETDRTVVFTVENNRLVAHPVITGSLLGTDIVIQSGLNSDMPIVIDARGLNEGDTVEVL